MSSTHKLIVFLAMAILFSWNCARAEEPVKVFILAGQSNMQGHGYVEKGYGGVMGAIGSLRYQVNNDPTNYGHLVDGGGNWVTRDDVWIRYTSENYSGTTLYEKGDLTVGFGVGDQIGPELGFGTVLDDSYNEQILLIKTAWGGKSLAVDFRPPTAVRKRGGDVGEYYNKVLSEVSSVLSNIGTHFPDYNGQGYELKGFGWHQGWNDRVTPAYAAEYEENMADFINDIRFDLGASDLPFVIGTTGMAPEASYTVVESAQLAMTDPVKYPQFAGNVKAVDTRSFWRESNVSPGSQGYHWNQNGESYYLIGDSMGDEMATMSSYDQFERAYMTVHQQTGEIKIVNPNTNVEDMELEAYQITSPSGALDATNWTSIDVDWSTVTETTEELSEEAQPNGGDVLIAMGNEVSLGDAWIQNLDKDLVATYTDTDGNVIDLNIRYLGSDNILADLNTDGTIDIADWGLFVEAIQADMSSLTAAQAYQKGDLDGDFDNDLDDFDLFRNAFELQNPAQGAFAAMLSEYAVPEPSSFSLFLFATGAGVLGMRRRRRAPVQRAPASPDSDRIGQPEKSNVVRGESNMTWTRTGILAGIIAIVIVCGSTNAMIINVNMYNNNGTPTPENPTTLEGPAGGLGETWNQFNTKTGSGLLDSTGAVTTVGYTNNVGTGWIWGNPDLSMLHSGRAHFGKGADTTHKITGLAPLSLYNVWVASYAHNNTLVERALGEWSTSNPTTTVGAQMIDSRTTGLNGTTWEDGVNYVLFEDVEASVNGEIILLGDAADGTVEQPEYGENYSTRLALSGFQIVEITDPIELKLQVNTVTGDITLMGDNLSPRDINYYQLTSAGNSLDANGWSSLADQDFEGNGSPDGSGNGWEEGGGVGSHALAEAYLLGDSPIPASASISLGRAYDTSVDAQDLVFSYRSDTGRRYEPEVEYVAHTPDLDGNGTVDSSDLNLLLSAFSPLATGIDGDAPYGPDELDFLLENFGRKGLDTSAASVPEPSSMLLLAFGLAGLGLWRKRRTV